MRNVILFSLGFVVMNFAGCASKEADRKVTVEKLEKSSKKVVKKNSPEVEIKRTVDNYRTVVSENIQRNKNQKEAHKKFEKNQDKLLKEMELARKNFVKTNNREKYIKIKDKITKKLNLAQEKLDRTIKANEIINYTEDKNKIIHIN